MVIYLQQIERKEKAGVPAFSPAMTFEYFMKPEPSSLMGGQEAERNLEFGHFCYKGFWFKCRMELKLEQIF